MVIHINSWKPDTCGCIIHYQWDDSVPQQDIVTELFAVERVCEAHLSLVKPEPTLLSSKVKDDKHSILTQAIENNKQRNLTKIHGTNALLTKKELRAPKPKRIEDEEKRVLTEQLEKHSQDVKERYDAILSTDFAMSTNVYDAVVNENRLKNKTLSNILDNTPSLRASDAVADQRRLKDSVEYKWEWIGEAPNRKLKVSFVDK